MKYAIFVIMLLSSAAFGSSNMNPSHAGARHLTLTRRTNLK